MKIYSETSCSRRGLSRLLILIVIGSIVLVILAVFYRLRQNTMAALEDSKRQRMERADHLLDNDVRRLLLEIQVELNKRDTTSSKKLLRKASIMDSHARFSDDLRKLKVKWITLEADLAKQVVLVELIERLRAKLTQEKFDEVSQLLDDATKKGLDSKELQAFKREFARVRELRVQRELLVAKINRNLNLWELDLAAKGLATLSTMHPLKKSLSDLNISYDQRLSLHKKALSAAVDLKSQDEGKYSPELNQALQKLLKEIPEHPVLLELQKLFTSYPQTIRVPADFASLEDALLNLKPGGTIHLGEGVFYFSSLVDKPVNILGAGVNLTRVESGLSSPSGIRFNHVGGTSSLSGISFVGSSESFTEQALVLLEAGGLKVEDCQFFNSAAHGIAISGGELELLNSSMHSNRWCGVAIRGKHSKLTIQNSQLSTNGNHGLSIWGEAKAKVSKSKFDGNAQSGMVASGENTQVHAKNCAFSRNRECGIVTFNKSQLVGSGLEASSNILSGVVIQQRASASFSKIKFSDNKEYGCVISPNSKVKGLGENIGEGNGLGSVLRRQLK